MECFTKDNFILLCDKLTRKDKHLKNVIKQHDYPPLWSRVASFATLIHIILEQQVSLASAKAAFLKLEAKIGHITPEKIIQLSDEEMKACYFSRQKIKYAKHLATAIINNELSIEQLNDLPDESLRTELKKIKGIGDWTVDIYLLFALQRCDVFPTGDLAMMNAFKETKQLPKHTTKEDIVEIAEQWRPYRSIATYLLWHHYIKSRNIRS